MKTQDEAAVVSVRDNPDVGMARINLRWEGSHQISDFDLDKLGRVLDSEDETEHTGWVFVERPVRIEAGATIPMLKK